MGIKTFEIFSQCSPFLAKTSHTPLTSLGFIIIYSKQISDIYRLFTRF